MPMLKLLGGASIEGPEGPLAGAIAQRQRLAFLALLATTPTGLMGRDKLLALLWPDLDSGKARRALSNALYVVKKELGEDSITTVGDDLRLDTSVVSVDVLHFQEAVDRGELEEAIVLYSGPFLDGVHVRDAPEFEKWVDGERTRLAEIYADVLERLADKATEEGRPSDATHWWQRLAVHDPYSSRIALSFMEALAAAGDRAGALQHAQVHTALLREELEVPPDPAVAQLVERLRSGGPARATQIEKSAGVLEAAGESAGDAEKERPTQEPPRAVQTAPTATPTGPPTAPEGEPDGAPTPTPLTDRFLQWLGRQKVVQWALAYLAGAWIVLQVLDILAETWGVPLAAERGVGVSLAFGFLLTLVLVWYHGEEGRQRVSGPELLIIATLLFIAGGVLALLRQGPAASSSSEVLPPLSTHPLTGVEDDRPAIAVLPFQNFSPDASDAYFADGMHEEIISSLAKVSALKVISRSSVMQYREERPTAPEMAAALGVDYFLEGSARLAGGLVRLTAQLIDARSDAHLWSEDYEEVLTPESLFAVQSEIARQVAARMEATLTPADVERLDHRPTKSMEAYDLYLHGRFFWNQRTDRDMLQAIQLFQEAIALDSLYALAYVGLADTYLTLLSWDFLPYEDAAPPAERALQRALALNPLMGEAHTSLATLMEGQGDWLGAREEYLQGLQLSPDHATGHHWFALALAKRRFFDDALLHIRYAAGLDPLSRMINASYGRILHLSGDGEGAVARLTGLTQREPAFAYGWFRLGEAYADLGRYEDAVAATDRAMELEPLWRMYGLSLAHIYARMGRRDEAIRMAEELWDGIQDPTRLALVYGAAGYPDRAFELLEEGIENRSPFISELWVEPGFDPIRSDPRWGELMRRLGYSE